MLVCDRCAHTLVSFFCLIRPAFLGATERTPGLVVFAGLDERILLVQCDFGPQIAVGTVDCGGCFRYLVLSGTYFLPGPVGPAFFNDPCTMVVSRWGFI